MRDLSIDFTFKSFPGSGEPLADLAASGWNALRPPMGLPLLVLKQSALQNNLEQMAAYCERHGVALAPHGKTHMSPQLFALQQQHGAWAVTVATTWQAEVYRRNGVRRLLIANELIAAADLDWLARTLRLDPTCEMYVVVDSVAGVDRLAAAVANLGGEPLPVLLEVGAHAARAGVRDVGSGVDVAEAVGRHETLTLVGIEGFEGAVPPDRVREFLAGARTVLEELLRRDLVAGSPIVTFGGSRSFDVVVDTIAAWDVPVRVVLRSGCYLTHDHGQYAAAFSDQTGWRPGEQPALEPAMELWAVVASRPEPDLAIVGFGRRDASFDAGLPIPLTRRRGDDSLDLRGVAVVEHLNDQHAFVRLQGPDVLAVGDLVSLGISHPCTSFDKWRLIPVVDDDYAVVDAVRTFF